MNILTSYNIKIIHQVRKPKSRGYTLLELAISQAILVTVILSSISVLISLMQMNEIARENALAINAARATIEALQDSAEFGEVFQCYNDEPDDDPDGPGTAQGADFNIEKLSPLRDDPDGMPGKIMFPGASGVLLENVNDPGLGMPQDLNGDGNIDDLNHASDYILLPVRVRLRWQGYVGPRSFEIQTFLVEK